MILIWFSLSSFGKSNISAIPMQSVIFVFKTSIYSSKSSNVNSRLYHLKLSFDSFLFPILFDLYFNHLSVYLKLNDFHETTIR